MDGHLFAATADHRLRVRPATPEPAAWRDIGEADGAMLLAATDGYLLAARRDGWLRARPGVPAEAVWRSVPYQVWSDRANPMDGVAMTALDGMLYLADSRDRLWQRARPDVWETEGELLHYYHSDRRLLGALFGDAGDDVLDGGPGNNRLSGDADAGRFILATSCRSGDRRSSPGSPLRTAVI